MPGRHSVLGTLVGSALALGLLALFETPGCTAEVLPGGGAGGGGRALLQAQPTQQQQVQQQRRSLDITVEEGILQTYAPPTVKGLKGGNSPAEAQRQQQAPQTQQQQQRQMQGSQSPNDAQRQRLQNRLLRQQEQQRLHQERQRQQQAQHAEQERLSQQQARQQAQAQQQAPDAQQATLGRQSLRLRKQAAQQPVTHSRKGDAFAEATEKQLAAARQRLAEQRAQQTALYQRWVAAAAAGSAGGGAGNARQQQQQQQQASQTAPKQQQQAAPGGHQQQEQEGAGRPRQRIPLALIIIMTVVMAAAAGLGALPFFFVRTMSDNATGVATAIACGVMLAASFDLVHEGEPYGAMLCVLGVLLGGAFIRWVQQKLDAYEDIQFGSLQGNSARKTVLMVGIMAAHALGEGCAVGVSFCGDRGWAQGVLTTLAIGVHNIPEGLAKATVLVGQGISPQRALGWSILTCLPQPLVAVPSFIFVEAFMVILPVALGFAAGCMIWMVFAELLPDALENTEAAQVATAATVAAAGLEGFRMLFASMEQADGSFGGAAAAAQAFGILGRMGPPLLVLLPAVATAAAGSGALAGSAIPAPVAWGVAAAVAASTGGGVLLDQLLSRAQLPTLHTLVAGAVGAAVAVLLHHQLLAWASGAAAALASRMSKNGAARSAPDVEALELAVQHQHHLHQHLHQTLPKHQHHHVHHDAVAALAVSAGGAGAGHPPPPQEVFIDGSDHAGGVGNGLNGFGGSSSSLMYQAPYHRGSMAGSKGSNGQANGLAGSTNHLPSGACTPPMLAGTVTPRRWRPAALLPSPHLAAAALAVLVLAAAAVPMGWRLACSLLLLGTDRSAAILPAAALLVVPALGAGALLRTLPSGRGTTATGAWAGGGLASIASATAAFTAARAHESAHTATLVKSFLYPYGTTDTAEGIAAGALCAAAYYCLAAGTALKARSARGGLVLGLAVAALLAGLRLALCKATPYCLSLEVLLQDR